MYPPKEPTHFLVPIPVQPPLPLPIGMPGQFAPQLQEHLLMHVPVHRQMPMVRCPKTGEFIPIPAVPEVYHKVTYEGKPGEFHCMKCVRICDYINNIYCCDEAKNKNSQKKKCDSHFLQMCFIQAAMKTMVDALIANKAIINEDGSCFFCHNETQHSLGWCRSKSIVQLYNHAILKEERKMFMWLNKYLDLRKTISISEMEARLKKATEEMEGLVRADRKNTSLKLQLHRLRRGFRHAVANEEKALDKENEGIHQRFVENFKAKREESVARLTVEGQFRDTQVRMLAQHMERLGF